MNDMEIMNDFNGLCPKCHSEVFCSARFTFGPVGFKKGYAMYRCKSCGKSFKVNILAPDMSAKVIQKSLKQGVHSL